MHMQQIIIAYCCLFPVLRPPFVVINTTPLDPRAPYIAVEAAIFLIRLSIVYPVGKHRQCVINLYPSTTYNGDPFV